MKKKLYIFLGALVIGVGVSIFSLNHARSKNVVPHVKVKIPDITIIGPINMADGIGRQTAELANAFMNDFRVQIISRYVDDDDVPASVLNAIKWSFTQFGKVIIFEESLWDPNARMERILKTVKQEDQIRIAYTMLESSRIPHEWALHLNLYFDAAVVPDEFLVEAYRESGVTIPIFVIPLGLDLTNFLSQPLKEKRQTPMVFANLSSCLDRKNQVLLIQAFAKALGNNKDAILKINCRGGDEEAKNAIIDEIIKQNCSNIQFTEAKFRKDAYLEFFKTVDCYVSLSKGEGFSIQPREAMALGIPVITTDNTGQSTICKTGLVKVVNSPEAEPAYYFKRKLSCGHRFNCSVDEAADAIRDVYLNYDAYLSKGPEARKWAAQYCYSNEGTKLTYKTLLAPKKVVLGPENMVTDEYLMTTSQELFDKYQKLIEHWQKNGTQLEKWKAKHEKI